MVFNATLNNISVISWLSVLLVEKTGLPGENHRTSPSLWKTYLINRQDKIYQWKTRVKIFPTPFLNKSSLYQIKYWVFFQVKSSYVICFLFLFLFFLILDHRTSKDNKIPDFCKRRKKFIQCYMGCRYTILYSLT